MARPRADGKNDSLKIARPSCEIHPRIGLTFASLDHASIDVVRQNGSTATFEAEVFDRPIPMVVSLRHGLGNINEIVIRRRDPLPPDVDAASAFRMLEETLTSAFGEPLPPSDSGDPSAQNPFVQRETEHLKIIHTVTLDAAREERIAIVFKSVEAARARLLRNLPLYLSQGGGLLFGLLMFLAFGLDQGYGARLLVICLAGGVMWGALFQLFFFSLTKHAKPVFYTKRNAAMLDEAERRFDAPFHAKFMGLTRIGTGLGQTFGQVNIYLRANDLFLTTVHHRRILAYARPYREIDRIVKEGPFAIIVFQPSGIQSIRMNSVSDVEAFASAITPKIQRSKEFFGDQD